jgi:protein-L-isoaspartate O-methyltransferase
LNNRNRQAAVQARASARTAVGTAHRQWEAACAALIAGGCTVRAVEEAETVLEDAQRHLRRAEAAYAHLDVLVPWLPGGG